MSGISWTELSEEEKQRLKQFYPVSLMNDMVRYETGLVMPRVYAEQLEEQIYNFQLREDDIWIVTYPKCGTTWTQELVWTLINDVDQEKGKVPIATRYEQTSYIHTWQLKFGKSILNLLNFQILLADGVTVSCLGLHSLKHFVSLILHFLRNLD